MDENIKVSIITPYHNTNSQLFDVCFDSVVLNNKFDKFEWIIVLHNCDEKHRLYVENKTNNISCIKLFFLNDDIHTPSSPRNYGLKQAKSEYVFFLDSDDELYGDAFKNINDDISDCEIVVYNANLKQDDNDIIPLKLDLAYDKRKVIKSNVDKNNLLYGIGQMVWGKLYKLEFLIKNNIFFDNDLMIGEDMVFSAKCYLMSNNILIEPNKYIYIYHQNKKSLLQNINVSDISEDVIFLYLDRVIEVVSDKYNIELFLIEALSFAAAMLFDKNLKKEDRIKIYNFMKKYKTKIDFDKKYDDKNIYKKINIIKIIF